MSKSWSEEMVYRYQKEIQLLTKERDKLKKELSISNNALEMACEYVSSYSEACCNCFRQKECPCGHGWWTDACVKYWKECLLKEAEEMMKSE